MRDLTKMTNIEDLRVVCKRNVPKMFYEYVDTGSWTESTYRENVSDFNPIKFRQRILVDMDNRTLESTLLGQKVKFPAMTAPVGFMGMMWADGEIHMAKDAFYDVYLLYRRFGRSRSRALLVSVVCNARPRFYERPYSSC